MSTIATVTLLVIIAGALYYGFSVLTKIKTH